jgi:2-polyprenyl-3-methyl-5-hydroxy-6-metoxy-1,4-benzoquinol methylase
VLRFARFPFVIGVTDRPQPVPCDFPFVLAFDRERGFVAQVTDAAQRRRLEDTYRQGSMLSTPVGESAVNRQLAVELVAFLEACTGGLRGKSFAEPGCGTGSLLRAILDAGAGRAVGYEPGIQAEHGAARYGVPIERAFFHAGVTQERFDCIYHYGVLEHVEDPAAFLGDCLERLVPGGVLAAVVPNCEEDMRLGNVSVLAHEHLNYFTPPSLANLFMASGLCDVRARPLAFSKGILAVWGRKGAVAPCGPSPDPGLLDAEAARFDRFAAALGRGLDRLAQRAALLAQRGESLGLYGVPTPLAGLVSGLVGARAFDGDPCKHGGHFAGCAGAIEPPQRLATHPVDELWIAPVHHDAAIRSFLAGLLPHDVSTRIVSVRVILEQESHGNV